MDTGTSTLTLLLATLGLIGVGWIAGVDAHVDRVVRTITVFWIAGTYVAYRRSQRIPGADPFPIITRWSLVGFFFGVLLDAGVLLFGV